MWDDGRASSRLGTAAGLRPTYLRYAIARDGVLAPVYSFIPSEDDPLNNPGTDDWSDGYYTQPDPTGIGNPDQTLDGTSNDYGEWVYVGDVHAYRHYSPENEVETGPTGDYAEDRPIMAVIDPDEVATTGDRIKYEDRGYELEASTPYDNLTLWDVTPVN